MLDDNGHMEPTDVDRDLDIDIAVRWGEGYEPRAQSYVNIVATPEVGTSRGRLRAGSDPVLHQRPAETRLLKTGEEVVKDDVMEGLTAVVTVGWPSRSSRSRPRKCWAPRRSTNWWPRRSNAS